MSLYKCLAALALFLVHGAVAQDRFQVASCAIEIPEASPVPGQSLLLDQHLVTFIPPSGATMTVNASQRTLRFQDRDGRFLITLKITAHAVTNAPSDDLWRPTIQALYPGANIIQSAPFRTGIGAGWEFYTEQLIASSITSLVTRHVFIPTDAGLFELTLVTENSRINEVRQNFATFVTSLTFKTRLPGSASQVNP